MFSKEYFNYLLKSKKYLLLFVFLLTIMNILSNKTVDITLGIECVICFGLAYFLPVYIFSYIHNKKAVDTFFSMPISRKAMLITAIIFIILSCYIPLALATTVFCVSKEIGLTTIVYLSELLVAISAIVVFNTAIYLTANNVLDGVIMICAYTALPLAIYLLCDSLAASYIAGVINVDVPFIGYLSPIYLCIKTVEELMYQGTNWAYTIGLIIILIVFSIILIKAYVNRKVERADTPSDRFFSYPFIIYVYVFICLIMISSANEYNYSTILEFLKDNFIIYVILFAIFIAAHFIYKRKLYFSYKLVAFYVAALIISLIFTSTLKTSQGFGLADRMTKTDAFARYEYTGYTFSDSLVKEYRNKINNDGVIYYVSIYANDYPQYRFTNVELDKQTYDILEKIRLNGKNDFYNYNKRKSSASGTLNVITKEQANYSYQIFETIDYNTLVSLAKDKRVIVRIDTDSGSYRLNANGELVKDY